MNSPHYTPLRAVHKSKCGDNFSGAWVYNHLNLTHLRLLTGPCLAVIKVTSMGIIIKDKGGDAFKPCPAGTHAARVCEVVFIGTVHEEFKGVAKDVPQIKLSFEVPAELREDGKPFVVSTMPMTASINKKASFRKLVQGIVTLTPETEKEFDAMTLIGQTCLINVVHTPSKTDANTIYANIVSASPLPKGMKVPAPINEQFVFDINISPLGDIDKLPEFIQKKVKSTPEYLARIAGGEQPVF